MTDGDRLGLAATIDSDFESGADLAHPFVAQSSEALDEDGDGDALCRVKVDAGTQGDRVVAGVENHLA